MGRVGEHGRSVVRSSHVQETSLGRSTDGPGKRCQRSGWVREGSEGLGPDSWKGMLPSAKMKQVARGDVEEL